MAKGMNSKLVKCACGQTVKHFAPKGQRKPLLSCFVCDDYGKRK